MAIRQAQITFKSFEKYRYGLRKTASKHLKTIDEEWLALILFAGYLQPVEVSKEVKSHTSAVKLKIVSGKQKGKILKHSEIVAHKQKEVKGGAGGGRIFFLASCKKSIELPVIVLIALIL